MPNFRNFVFLIIAILVQIYVVCWHNTSNTKQALEATHLIQLGSYINRILVFY